LVLISLIFFLYRKKIKYVYYAIYALLIFSNGIFAQSLFRLIEYPWQREEIESVNKAYAIVVLSGGRKLPLGNSKIIEWNDPDRFFAGVELYKSGKGNKLIFTGGSNPYHNDLPLEGNIYLNEALALGIPQKDIITTYAVINTYQEAKAVKELLNQKIPLKKQKIILVTSAFHMNRAKRIFERKGIHVKAFPVDFKSNRRFKNILLNPIEWIPSSKNLNQTSFAFREIIGRIIYRIFI
tara:strand:+ start:115 stop:828 length:714 start_codon:yes stop_codon:yes gene_type:complete